MSAVLTAEKFSRAAAEVFVTLLDRIHPAWVRSMGIDMGAVSAVSPASRAVWTEVVAVRFDLRWPDLSVAAEPLQLLWLLPPLQIQRVCCARALFACRDALMRSVDAHVRRSARALVGPAAFDALTVVPGQRVGSAPVLAEPDTGRTSVSGLALLQTSSTWADARAHRLVQLALPPLEAAPAQPASSDAEHALFASHLPTIFPEHSWLFGSNPDHTTSV